MTQNDATRISEPADSGAGRDEGEFAAEALSLWRITFGPVIWVGYFTLSYGAAALVCAKAPDTSVATLRLAMGGTTLVALALIGWIGWRAFRQWDRSAPDTDATEEHRHRFLGHAAFLLALIAAIGVVFTALPFLTPGTCL